MLIQAIVAIVLVVLGFALDRHAQKLEDRRKAALQLTIRDLYAEAQEPTEYDENWCLACSHAVPACTCEEE